jgi:hypothetical protein
VSKALKRVGGSYWEARYSLIGKRVNKSRPWRIGFDLHDAPSGEVNHQAPPLSILPMNTAYDTAYTRILIRSCWHASQDTPVSLSDTRERSDIARDPNHVTGTRGPAGEGLPTLQPVVAVCLTSAAIQERAWVNVGAYNDLR